MVRIITTILGLIVFSACSASYDELKALNTVNDDSFKNNLLKLYKEKAIFEAEQMHDWDSAKLYSEKALSADLGIEIMPEKISHWNLPKEHISELTQSYNNLMTIYNEAKLIDHYNLAVAIISLDCWAEQQEENWQTWDIKNCKEDFLGAMHNIYDKISNNKKLESKTTLDVKQDEKTESVSMVTTNEKKEIMQIIYFDFDEFKLSEVSIKNINNFLNKYNDEINNFLIVGHADTKGSKNYNLKLSIKRAEAVKAILIKEKVKESKIKILGKGEEFLAVPTKDEIKHPANRRAEISILN